MGPGLRLERAARHREAGQGRCGQGAEGENPDSRISEQEPWRPEGDAPTPPSPGERMAHPARKSFTHASPGNSS